MNNEIKEILDNLQYGGFCWKRIYDEDIKKLVDYITNLEEDNIMYSQLKDEYSNIISDALYKLYDNVDNIGSKFYYEMLEILLGRNNL